MTEQVMTIVRIPITEVEDWIRTRHALPKTLSDFRIEEATLVLYFSDDEISPKETGEGTQKGSNHKRRAHRKRNRMKTRGWQVVGRIVNSKDQKCSIYKPFVDALRDPRLTIEERKKMVENILRSNRNRPSEESVRYFLENTLEYLKKPTENQE